MGTQVKKQNSKQEKENFLFFFRAAGLGRKEEYFSSFALEAPCLPGNWKGPEFV